MLEFNGANACKDVFLTPLMLVMYKLHCPRQFCKAAMECLQVGSDRIMD